MCVPAEEMDGNGVRGEGREWHCDLVNSVRAERRAKERDAALLEREHNRRQVLDVPRAMGVAVDRPDFHVLVKLVDHAFKPLLSEGHQLIARDDSVVVEVDPTEQLEVLVDIAWDEVELTGDANLPWQADPLDTSATQRRVRHLPLGALKVRDTEGRRLRRICHSERHLVNLPGGSYPLRHSHGGSSRARAAAHCTCRPTVAPTRGSKRGESWRDATDRAPPTLGSEFSL